MSTYSLYINAFRHPQRDGLFHSGRFFRLHDNGAGRYYEWLDENGGFGASIHFTETEKGVWRSPARGTFAGFDFDKSIPLDDFARFITDVERDLKSQGARTIEILPAPSAHDPEKLSILYYLLTNAGYITSRSDLNFTIDVSATPLQGRMRETQAQRVKKCLKKGFAAKNLPIQDLPHVYETIAANAAAKGFALSMTCDQIKAMADALPGSLILFGVQDNDVLASAAICVRLSAAVLYIFYVGDHPAYQADSPVVMLVDAIYAYAKEKGFSLLDYGTATNGSDFDEGLINFKRRLGFGACLKIRMKKDL